MSLHGVVTHRSATLITLGALFTGVCISSAHAAFPADSLIQLTSSNLPIVVINTHGLSIPDEPKITASMGIIDNGAGVRNYATDPFNGYNGWIGIEIRGSSTQQFPKKQYGIETRDSTGADIDVPLLGLPAEADWVLSAPYNDKSLMRDALMHTIARSLGRYARRARYCEVILNDVYVGVYVLLERIKRTKNRLNITKMSEADTTGDALTGGYIFKIDKLEGSEVDGWYSGFPPYPSAWQQIYYQFDYPKPSNIVAAQRGYISRYVRDFEITMAESTYADSLLGYPTLLDVGSFVDYLIVTELCKNVDGYRLSAFLHKDRDSKGGKIVAGPVWDFNHALGNSDYYDASLIPGFQLDYFTTSQSFHSSDYWQTPFWWGKLFAEPTFRRKIEERYFALRQNQLSLTRIHALIDSMAAVVDEAKTRNFLRWDVLGRYVWPNYFVGSTYAEEIAYLKGWVASRLTWLDANFRTTDVTGRQDVTGAGDTPGPRLFQNYPNPFNPTTSIRYHLSAASNVRLAVYDLLGREVAMLVNEVKAPGSYSARFDAAGLAAGVYLCRMTAGEFTRTRTMLLVK
jgi:hypothetical protein